MAGQWGRLPPAGKGLDGWNFLLVLKEGVPGHSYQLSQMWGGRGKRVMGIESCLQSKIKTGDLMFL